MGRIDHLNAALEAFKEGIAHLGKLLSTGDEQLLHELDPLYVSLVTTELDLADVAAASRPADDVANLHRQAYLHAEQSKGRWAAALLASEVVQPGGPKAVQLKKALDEKRDELTWLFRQRDGSQVTVGNIWRSFESTLEGPDLEREARERCERRADAVWAELQSVLQELVATDADYAFVALYNFVDSFDFKMPFEPEAVAAAIPSGGALVLLYPLDHAIACFVIHASAATTQERKEAVLTAIAPLQYTLRDKSVVYGKAALRALLDQAFASSSGIPAVRALEHTLGVLAHALHPALVPLLPPPDPDNPPTLILVPTGPLHRLPLHALPWPDYDGRLLDGYAVSYATSADLLPLSARKLAVAAGTVALAPGLPLISAEPVPATLAAASIVASGNGAELLLRDHATVAALMDAKVAAHRRWVFLATHGRAGVKDTQRAGLLLCNGRGEANWLSAAEILCQLPLDNVEHLGLAACSTHADNATAGDLLAGLLLAFLYRGARSVQATLWPVREDAAALVSAWTWEALLAGATDKARALRGAVQRLRWCSGREAGAELWRLAVGLAAVLPADDPAHEQLKAKAKELENQGRPFLRSPDWAPFVLHGAPITTPLR